MFAAYRHIVGFSRASTTIRVSVRIKVRVWFGFIGSPYQQEAQLSLRDRATRACQLKSGKVLHKCRRLVFEKL